MVFVRRSSIRRHHTGAARTARAVAQAPLTVTARELQHLLALVHAGSNQQIDSISRAAPLGMVAGSSVLPNSPYKNARGALVHTWREDRWFSWIFGVGSAAAADENDSTKFSFSEGGHQGSRGGKGGQEFFIENVMEELDAPGMCRLLRRASSHMMHV